MAKIVPINSTPTTTLSPDQIAQLLNQNPQINHEIISYITKIQTEQDRYKTKVNFSQTTSDLADKKPQSQYIGLNDNIHIDADKKSKARRSLLYLLNNLSGGSFCPEIIDYFEELKKVKINDQMNIAAALNESVKKTPKLNDSINLKNPLTRTKTLKDQLMSNNENANSTFKYNFKKREDMKENIDKIDENEELFGIKAFKNDYNLKEYEILYSVNEIENGLKKFQYTKEALAKKRLTKKRDKSKKKRNTFAELSKKSKERNKSMIYNKTNKSLLNNTNKETQLKQVVKPQKFFDINAIEEAEDSFHSSQKDNE